MQQGFVNICNLTRYFNVGEKRLPVLTSANLQIQKGETIALLGRSGAGKSTLLNLMGGIDAPDGGYIKIGNHNLGQLNERQRTLFRRQHIGYVHQFFNLVPTLTAAENIALPLELNRVDDASIKEKVASLLEVIGLTGRGQDFPDQLSGGEQQRIALARAIIHRPMLLLADEPTGNLDAHSGQQVLKLLHALVSQFNCTLMMVTHSLVVAKSSDRIITLDQGQLLERAGEFAW